MSLGQIVHYLFYDKVTKFRWIENAILIVYLVILLLQVCVYLLALKGFTNPTFMLAHYCYLSFLGCLLLTTLSPLAYQLKKYHREVYDKLKLNLWLFLTIELALTVLQILAGYNADNPSYASNFFIYYNIFMQCGLYPLE